MKNFRQSRNHRPKKNRLITGATDVIRALKENIQLDRIFILATFNNAVTDQLKKLAAECGVPVNKVPIEKLNSFNTGEHNGCVAMLSKIKYSNLQDLISFSFENSLLTLFVMLDGITDIRNIGAIARSAYAMGVTALIIPEKGVGALNEDAIFTSAGALEHLPVCRVNGLMKAVDELHLNGIKVYATEMTAQKNIFEVDFKDPCAIVMGGEEQGIYPALLKICDEQLKIPMPGNFESLNVSVATGMVLYEAIRQRFR